MWVQRVNFSPTSANIPYARRLRCEQLLTVVVVSVWTCRRDNRRLQLLPPSEATSGSVMLEYRKSSGT
jgi:hypothetical protein